GGGAYRLGGASHARSATQARNASGGEWPGEAGGYGAFSRRYRPRGRDRRGTRQTPPPLPRSDRALRTARPVAQAGGNGTWHSRGDAFQPAPWRQSTHATPA